jgi:hypothetical protein
MTGFVTRKQQPEAVGNFKHELLIRTASCHFITAVREKHPNGQNTL